MGKTLVIVESDAKSKTINRFLGNNFVVKASIGHIKNLPKNRLGVDIENGFEPEYVTIKGRAKLIKDLKKQALSSDDVLIATDPDREGEAIAYHLAKELESSKKPIKRVLFHEITQKAVQDAVHKPISISMKKVEAQSARRVMDRLVGYKVSPFLWKTVYRGLSAGRVQSVALKLICEREEEIKKFVSEEYWSIEADFLSCSKEQFKSRLVKIAGKDPVLPDEGSVQKHISQMENGRYSVTELVSKTVEKKPFAPYTTSTMQQEAARKLGMTTKSIMSIAQELYEGVDLPEGRVGLITYMRTDSTRLSKTAVEEARQFIADHYGLDYVPKTSRVFRSKKGSQDAHEAIRPTSVFRTPKKMAAHLTPRQYKLYLLIWNRFVACQMASAKVRQNILEITSGDYLFRTTGSVVVFRGFMQLYEMEKEESEQTIFPAEINKGEDAALKKLHTNQHFTKPPARYNESSLVKELDFLGIGRPSTYALIISTLLLRKYAEKQGRAFFATDLGMAVNHILAQQFPNIFNVGFTALMETELDQIESGDKDKVQVLKDFYNPFSKAVSEAESNKDRIKEDLQEETKEQCPECGKDLIVKWGRNGRFIACAGYPDCKYTKPLEEEKIETDEICTNCKSPMIVKTGRFGRFLACSKYPECKTTKPFTLGILCPEKDCGGKIVERKTKKGKYFYGCSKYPECTFATWNKPVDRRCDICGHNFMEERSNKTKGAFYSCPACKHSVSIVE